MRKAVYLCLTTVVLAATALSQFATTTQAQQEDKVVVGTNLVTLNVIVTDSKGRYQALLTSCGDAEIHCCNLHR